MPAGSLLSVILLDLLPPILAAALLYAARRMGRTPRGQHAWARALAILGCQLMTFGFLLFLVVPLLALLTAVPPPGVADPVVAPLEPTVIAWIAWSASPFLTELWLRTAAWLMRRHARRNEERPTFDATISS